MKASAAINETGLVAAEPKYRVVGVARTLREDDPTVWPEGGKGHGQAADVEPQNLISLGIGLAVADPITEVPSRVRLYRSLVADDKWRDRSAGKGILSLLDTPAPAEWPVGGTLASDLEWMLHKLATDPAWRSATEKATFSIHLSVGWPLASAHIQFGSWWLLYEQPQESLIREVPKGAIKTEKTIPLGLLAAFADMWADTMADRASRKAKTTGRAKKGSAHPKSEEAGTPARVPASSDSLPSDDPRLDTDTPRKSSPRNADLIARVCPPSSGAFTLSDRTRRYDPHPAPHQHALL